MHPYKKGADGIRLDYRLNRRHCKPAIDEKSYFFYLMFAFSIRQNRKTLIKKSNHLHICLWLTFRIQ